MTHIKTISLSTLLLALMIGFQNCSNPVSFSDTQFSLQGVKMDGTENQYEEPGEEPPPEQQPEEPVADLPEEEEEEEIPGNKPPKDDEKPGKKPVAGIYKACILDGPGKSMKLGLVETNLAGVHGVSRSVCITEKACLEIVSKKFAVKGSYLRGYCAHNPNVVKLDDAQIEALIK